MIESHENNQDGPKKYIRLQLKLIVTYFLNSCKFVFGEEMCDEIE